jgi:hypothetical protein
VGLPHCAALGRLPTRDAEGSDARSVHRSGSVRSHRACMAGATGSAPTLASRAFCFSRSCSSLEMGASPAHAPTLWPTGPLSAIACESSCRRRLRSAVKPEIVPVRSSTPTLTLRGIEGSEGVRGSRSSLIGEPSSMGTTDDTSGVLSRMRRLPELRRSGGGIRALCKSHAFCCSSTYGQHSREKPFRVTSVQLCKEQFGWRRGWRGRVATPLV